MNKNIELYRLMRRNDLLSYLRGVEDKEDKRIMELLTENQVERVNIIKDEHKYYLRLLGEFENIKITPIEKLEIIDMLKIFDADYYLKVKKFEEDIQKLNLKENEFLSDFLVYVEFQERAVKMYKYDFDIMYGEFARKYGEIVDRERAQAKLDFENRQKKIAEDERNLKELEIERDTSVEIIYQEKDEILKQMLEKAKLEDELS